MPPLLVALAAGCTVSTSRLDGLEPCDIDAHCPPSHVCVQGWCALSSTPDAGVSGQCSSAAVCDDGDACNGHESCVGGLCVAGEPMDCSFLDDPRLCFVGVCEQGICGARPAPDDTPCQDDVFCKSGDVCSGGVCVGGTLPTCDDGDACTVDTCDEEADRCHSEMGTEGPIRDDTCADGIDNDCDGQTDDADTDCESKCPSGQDCDDGSFCNGQDRCVDDQCVNIGPPACDDDGLACTETCGEATRQCNVLTPGFCLIGGLCYDSGDPNPLNPCQECVPPISTEDWTNDDTNACTDGQFCNGVDVCVSGSCIDSGRLPCTDDGLDCTVTCHEATNTCNRPTPGFCIMDGRCYRDSDENPANPCEECNSSRDLFGWTADDTNNCSDPYDCTVDFCFRGECQSQSDPGRCPPGEMCVPECFGGPSGCGLPPGSLELSCESPVLPPWSSECSLSLISGTTTGQAACMSCQAEAGFSVAGSADFQLCPELDGFVAVAGTPDCGTIGGETFLQAANQSWSIERSFDTSGLYNLALCFSYAESAMDGRDSLLVEACADGTCAAPVTILYDFAGPSSGDTSWHRYCFDLVAIEPMAADNPSLVLRFTASSGSSGQIARLDHIDLRGSRAGCGPRRTLVAQDSFLCPGTNCEVTDWMAGASCDIASPCGGGGLQATSQDSLEVCRELVLGPMSGDPYVSVGVSENNADDTAQAETLAIEFCEGTVEAGCVCASGWREAFAHVGDMDGVDIGTPRQTWVNLASLGFQGETLGLRLRATAQGPGDVVTLGPVEVGTIDYACSAGLSVGPISELGGGDYSVTVDSTGAQAVQMHCGWRTPPPRIDDQAGIDFVP